MPGISCDNTKAKECLIKEDKTRKMFSIKNDRQMVLSIACQQEENNVWIGRGNILQERKELTEFWMVVSC